MTELLKRWGGPVAMFGGALWVAYCALFTMISARQGKPLLIVEIP